jgi:sec-independent protein translocase protein TatB
VFNIGGGELIVILIIALIVLGPDKLPDAVRRAGRLYGELRRMSSGFQAELRDALDEPMREVRSTTDLVRTTFTGGADDEPAREESSRRTTVTPARDGTEAEPGPLDEPATAVPVLDDPVPDGEVAGSDQVTGDLPAAATNPPGFVGLLPPPASTGAAWLPPPTGPSDPGLPTPPGP